MSAGPFPTLELDGEPEAVAGLHDAPVRPGPAGSRIAVLDEVAEMIVDVIGEDYLLDVTIDRDTSFQDDLEIESIEFVALAEQLHERYGDRVDFVMWLADKDLDEIIALTVGELVAFIESCLGEG